MNGTISHTGKVWLWHTEKGSWHFITIDGDAGDQLDQTALMRKLEFGRRAGFGSLKVRVTLGKSVWQTSVFPSKEQGWLLPLKAAIRKSEGVADGDTISLQIKTL